MKELKTGCESDCKEQCWRKGLTKDEADKFVDFKRDMDCHSNNYFKWSNKEVERC